MESELMMIRRILPMLQEDEAQSQASRTAGYYNSGTQGLFNNSRPGGGLYYGSGAFAGNRYSNPVYHNGYGGPGGQNFSYNYGSGAFDGNRYSNPVYHNYGYGGYFVHNSGSTQGNGNGCFVKN